MYRENSTAYAEASEHGEGARPPETVANETVDTWEQELQPLSAAEATVKLESLVRQVMAEERLQPDHNELYMENLAKAFLTRIDQLNVDGRVTVRTRKFLEEQVQEYHVPIAA